MSSQPNRRNVLQVLGAAAAVGALPARAQTGAERPGYTFSVVPQFPAAELHADWTPLLERVSQIVGAPLSLRVAPSIPRFESELMLGTPDFAYMNPYHAVMAMRAQAYVPLLRDTKLLTGILVVRRDDPIRSVHELDGKELAFPAPNSFGASLWMRALLAEREHVGFTANYVQTHSNVYRQVLRGRAAAGGGVNLTLQQEDDDVRAGLRVLMETPGVAPHPLCAHPRVPLPLQQAVSDALLRLAGDTSGRTLLKTVALPGPVRADYARDYRPLEQFKLEKYVVLARTP